MFSANGITTKSSYEGSGGYFGTGYDAAKPSKRRRSVVASLTSEDDKLKEKPRKNLNAQTRDLRRNVVVARWIIARHLDFVCSHRFEPKTGNESVDKRLQDFVRESSKKENFDALGRHPLRRYIRLAEAGRLVDGGHYSIRMDDGTLQAREDDLLRTPVRARRSKENWVQGIRLDAKDRPMRYAFHKRRQGGNYELDRIVKSDAVIPFGYFDRFDQYRPVAPMAPAVNLIRDFYENIDYTSAKSKLASLFGFKLTREGYDNPESDLDGEDGSKGSQQDRDWNLSKGIEFFDLDPGENVDFLYVDTPGANQQAFFDMLVGLALKAVDLPFSFWREDYTNFFGNKIAFTIYQNSCRDKRQDVQDFLNDWLCWRIDIRRGVDIKLPKSFICDPRQWLWKPNGLPWFDPKDLQADLDAIEFGLKTLEDVAQERLNKSWERDILPQRVREKKLLEDAGLSSTRTMPALMVQNQNEGNDDAN